MSFGTAVFFTRTTGDQPKSIEGGVFFVMLSKQQEDYRCFRSKMHLKEIIFFAGRHLFRVSVIIIQIHLFFCVQMKRRRYKRHQRQTFSGEILSI